MDWIIEKEYISGSWLYFHSGIIVSSDGGVGKYQTRNQSMYDNEQEKFKIKRNINKSIIDHILLINSYINLELLDQVIRHVEKSNLNDGTQRVVLYVAGKKYLLYESSDYKTELIDDYGKKLISLINEIFVLAN